MARTKVPKEPEEPTAPAEATRDPGAHVLPDPGEEAPATLAEVAADLGEDPQALKIVITLKEGRGSIGVQRVGCDPFLLPLPDAGLANAIARLPEALVEADARWREQRQYPKYSRPAPSPLPAPERRVARPSTPRAVRAAPPTPGVERPRMF